MALEKSGVLDDVLLLSFADAS
eukprot:SAG31_NODE_2180_length_6247_cov_4.910052_1_plen_21_part_10